MATRAVGRGSGAPTTDWRVILQASVRRSVELIGAVALYAFVGFLALALVSYNQTDPSMSTAAGGPVTNWMGAGGAWFADALLTAFGLGSIALLPFLFLTARRLWANEAQERWGRNGLWLLLGMTLLGLALGLVFGESASSLPAHWGGIAGLVGSRGVEAGIALMPEGGRFWAWLATSAVIVTAGFFVAWRALALDRSPFALARGIGLPGLPRLPDLRPRRADAGEDDEVEAENGVVPFRADAPAASPRRPAVPDNRPPPEISSPAAPPAKADFGKQSKQGDFFGPYTLPPVALLDPAPENKGMTLDKMTLERNARLLESVLDDFHIKGQITAVRQGPVVTMYELEPAPGIKAQRVMVLAEDIARNMSAVSARVSTVPGRTVMGIELPNAHREMVALSEMLGSQAWSEHSGQLPIVLGKDIAGAPILADLAPMPHLLIAGTTGSGKSVGLNCIILSLLYRLTPDECRLILIDPKWLELSTYNDIPHLLAPVVTEPQRAVRALKWAVEQMEERYRMMSSLGVRNLQGFNDKVRQARSKGKPLGRRVQSGYDQETKQPIFEEEELEYDPLPQVVVVVDEFADLMVTAGKEVEVLIQRLTQKARAAGIHVIMATQRPSVDVITGVIKANLPTRISFNVTSKIDSRTILGEQGAEQLLGRGDMLYMSGGKQVMRVHGPFVSDDEVKRVADHWRAQGTPSYIDSVTEEPADGGFALDGAPMDESAEDSLYRKACQIVFESQKASASWIQRQLRIGYNNAARLIERMEADGFVGPPNHVGRREVYRDRDGNPL